MCHGGRYGGPGLQLVVYGTVVGGSVYGAVPTTEPMPPDTKGTFQLLGITFFLLDTRTIIETPRCPLNAAIVRCKRKLARVYSSFVKRGLFFWSYDREVGHRPTRVLRQVSDVSCNPRKSRNAIYIMFYLIPLRIHTHTHTHIPPPGPVTL